MLGGLLWVRGGEGNKAWRRVGVAGLVALISAYKIGWGFDLFCVAVIGLFAFWSYTVGYGIPDYGDPGSKIAQFWNRWINWQSQGNLLRFLTRATTGFLYGVSLVVLGYVTQHSFNGWLSLIGLVIGVPVIVNFEFDVKREGTLIGILIITLTLLV